MKPRTVGSAITRAKCAEQRCFYSWRIREALARNGRTSRTIAWELGISEAAVSQAISGKTHSPRVLDALRAAGVPEKYLFDPRHTGGRAT